MNITQYAVGKPFPGPVPKAEGCVLEIGPEDGNLVCLIQAPGLSRAERQAFKKSFSRYGYLEVGSTPPVAVWIWCWPPPLNPMDVNFDASLVAPKAINQYLAPEGSAIKNMITFFLLDRDILAGIKLVGLDPKAVALFHGTIQRQRAMAYTGYEFTRALDGVYAYSTNELFEMAEKFKKT